MKTAITTAVVLLLTSVEALSAPGGGHGNGIPWSLITYQAINIVVIAVGFVYFLRKPVSDFFKQRLTDYSQAAERAMQARMAAEMANREIKERLEKLERTADETIEKSKVEAKALSAKIVRDAQEAANRIERDTQRMVEAELEKAKTALRNDIIDEAFVAAEIALKEKMNEQEQKRLQGEFVNKIQVARS